ncbi:MAG: hypothetical protein J5602_12735 [Clostridia bacterium]|nr:hypothetical protein [Clostridia bacterium]
MTMEKRLERIAMKLERSLERLSFAEYLRYSVSWKRQLLVNFMGGLARGAGMAVGFAALGAAAVVLLRRLAALNVPVIGDYLAEVIRIVLERL